MRMLIFSEEYPPASIGGAATNARYTAEGLNALGQKIYIIANGKKQYLKSQTGVHIYRTGNEQLYATSNTSRLSFEKKMFEIAEGVISKNHIDKVIVLDIFCYDVARLVSKFHHLPLILVCQQSCFTQQKYDKDNHFVFDDIGISNNLLISLEKRVIEDAANIVFISRSLRDDMNDEYNIKGAQTVIHLGISSNGMRSLKNKYEDKSIHISACGRLVVVKNVKAIIEALPEILASNPNVVVDIIGDGPEKNSLKKLSHDLYVDKYVNFWGNLEHKKALEIMSRSTLAIIPTLWESFCYVATEYMGLEVPILFSPVDSLPEIVPVGLGFRLNVEMENRKRKIYPVEISSKVNEILRLSSDRLYNIGREERKIVLQYFSNERFVKQLYEFLNKAK